MVAEKPRRSGSRLERDQTTMLPFNALYVCDRCMTRYLTVVVGKSMACSLGSTVHVRYLEVTRHDTTEIRQTSAFLGLPLSRQGLDESLINVRCAEPVSYPLEVSCNPASEHGVCLFLCLASFLRKQTKPATRRKSTFGSALDIS